MSREDAEALIEARDEMRGAGVFGIHYFSGTQKRIKDTVREIEEMDAYLAYLAERYGFAYLDYVADDSTDGPAVKIACSQEDFVDGEGHMYEEAAQRFSRMFAEKLA